MLIHAVSGKSIIIVKWLSSLMLGKQPFNHQAIIPYLNSPSTIHYSQSYFTHPRYILTGIIAKARQIIVANAMPVPSMIFKNRLL